MSSLRLEWLKTKRYADGFYGVQADMTLSTQTLLDGLSQLNTSELEIFYSEVGRMLESRRTEAADSSLFSAIEREEEENVPIVEKLIPNSIALDGDSLFL